MKLSISNIAWDKEKDEEMYDCISQKGFDAIEIAPTRIFENNPYENLDEAKKFAEDIMQKYNLKISSMQSIWYGKQEKIFENEEERNTLLEYTKRAIDFASAIKCNNLVFGCPKNRNIKSENDYEIAIDFLNRIGDYAREKNTIFAIEPNPTIYNTNFINTTKEALDIVKRINNDGIKVNMDLGTILQNEESLEEIDFDKINHIHISEPNLEIIQKRVLHTNLANILKGKQYNNYISIEMKKCDSLDDVKTVMEYVRSVFK